MKDPLAVTLGPRHEGGHELENVRLDVHGPDVLGGRRWRKPPLPWSALQEGSAGGIETR